MHLEPGDAAALRAVLQKDLKAIAQLEEHARGLTRDDLSREALESLGFTLHTIYNALENSFVQISLTFENHVKDQSRWHREILEKMFLAVPPLRPAVLPEGTRALLSDLLAFRHFFRHSYELTLDASKTLVLARRWMADAAAVKNALAGFARDLPVAPA